MATSVGMPITNDTVAAFVVDGRNFQLALPLEDSVGRHRLRDPSTHDGRSRPPRFSPRPHTAFGFSMTPLSDDEYLLTDVQWRRQDRDGGFRPLHGFTTGHLVVEGGSAQADARFNDQFLSNRLSGLDQDGIPIMLLVEVLESDDAYTLSCSAPTLVRAGASYRLEVRGELSEVEASAL